MSREQGECNSSDLTTLEEHLLAWGIPYKLEEINYPNIVFFSCALPELTLYFDTDSIDQEEDDNFKKTFKSVKEKIIAQELTIDVLELNKHVTSTIDGMLSYDDISPYDHTLIESIKVKANIINKLVVEQEIAKGNYTEIFDIIDSNPYFETSHAAIILAIAYPDLSKAADPDHNISATEQENATRLISQLCNKINKSKFNKDVFTQKLNKFLQDNNIEISPETDADTSQISKRQDLALEIIDQAMTPQNHHSR